MLKKKLYQATLFFIYSTFVGAQIDSVPNYQWQIKPCINTGFVLVHRIGIGHLVKGYPTIYELNISKPTNGNKLWQLENNKPDIGISLQCVDFKNPSELGFAISAVPYIEIPFNKTIKASRMILRLCWGATYVTKHFDIKTNHKNIAVGSAFNAYVQFKWFWHLQLNKQWRFEPGIAFTHLSNGRAKVPNLGLNVVSLNWGLNYLIPAKTKISVSKIDSSTRVKSKNEFLVFAAVGFNQRSTNGIGYKSYVFSANYQRNVRNTHKFNAGLDLFYDQIYLIDYKNVFGAEAQGIDKLRLSAKLGYSYNVGRISFPIEMGYYVFQKTNPDAAVVTRLGVRYYTPCGLVAHFGLRTHFAVAYDFEYGLGYRFNFK